MGNKSETKRARFHPPTAKSIAYTPQQSPAPNPARQLPNEAIEAILGYLKAEEDLPALAKVARTSRRMYSIAIPKLYETVTITQRNKYQFGYGHSEDSKHFSIRRLTRKDTAASFTRKIILDDDSPKAIMVKGFRSVDQIVVSAQCLARHMPTAPRHKRIGGPSAYTFMSKAANGLMQCIATLASSRTSSTPLHVTFIMDPTVERFRLMEMFLREGALAGFTFDFLDWPSHDEFCHLWAAYYAGAPVQFAHNPFSQHSVDRLAMGLAHILHREDFTAPSSRIYLCDVPKLVLSSEELGEAAENVDHVAKLNVYNIYALETADNSMEPLSWIDFDSKVNFVESGFRPSPADVAAIMDGRQYIKKKNKWL